LTSRIQRVALFDCSLIRQGQEDLAALNGAKASILQQPNPPDHRKTAGALVLGSRLLSSAGASAPWPRRSTPFLSRRPQTLVSSVASHCFVSDPTSTSIVGAAVLPHAATITELPVAYHIHDRKRHTKHATTTRRRTATLTCNQPRPPSHLETRNSLGRLPDLATYCGRHTESLDPFLPRAYFASLGLSTRTAPPDTRNKNPSRSRRGPL
jgi:hypothetical protein